MNIPTMSRPLFNQMLLDNLDIFKIIPTDEAYASYCAFIAKENAPKVEKIAEITTAIATPGFKVSVTPGYMVSDIETTEVFKIAA